MDALHFCCIWEWGKSSWSFVLVSIGLQRSHNATLPTENSIDMCLQFSWCSFDTTEFLTFYLLQDLAHAHTQTHTRAHTRACTRAHPRAHAHMRAHTHARTHAHRIDTPDLAHTHKGTRTHARPRTRARTRARTHTCTRTHTHTHNTHTRFRTHTHTHTHAITTMYSMHAQHSIFINDQPVGCRNATLCRHI